jgi:hypothetical protein
MPAIQLTRLRIQCAALGEKFNQPETFVRLLHDLLDFYADRTYRPGRQGSRLPLIPAYQAPAPVMRQLESELLPRVNADSEAGLRLADLLWQETYLEPRRLAISVLAMLPESAGAAFAERLRAWSKPEEELALLNALLDVGSLRLAQIAPEQWKDVVHDWIGSSRSVVQQMGLRSLAAVLNTPQFENLPAMYNLLAPMYQQSPSDLQPELLAVARVLIERSPAETAAFLRHTLSLATGRGTARLIRKLLPDFRPDLQENLKAALNAQKS